VRKLLFLRDFRGIASGEIARFQQEEAEKLLQAGIAVDPGAEEVVPVESSDKKVEKVMKPAPPRPTKGPGVVTK
jgi:hypothetical protein